MAPAATVRRRKGRSPRPATSAANSPPITAAAIALSAMTARARKLLKEFDVRGGTPTTSAAALSGGNQQKVVLAREIDGDPKVLIAAQPTRGLDVGAIEFVHGRLLEQRDVERRVIDATLVPDERGQDDDTAEERRPHLRRPGAAEVADRIGEVDRRGQWMGPRKVDQLAEDEGGAEGSGSQARDRSVQPA